MKEPYMWTRPDSWKQFDIKDPENPVKYRIVEEKGADTQYIVEKYLPKRWLLFGDKWVIHRRYFPSISLDEVRKDVKKTIERDYISIWYNMDPTREVIE